MKEKPTGRESHFSAAAQDPQDVAIPPPPTLPINQLCFGARPRLDPNPIRLSQNSEQSRTSVKKTQSLQQSSVKAPKTDWFQMYLGVDTGCFQRRSRTRSTSGYFRNRSYDTMLPLFNRRNMKKFAILICVNRKICDNLELEKIVVLRKRIIPFIFSSLRNPFDPSQPSPICPVSFGIRNSWKITFPLYPRKYQMNNFNQLLRSEISKLVILLKDQLLPIGDIRSFF